MKKAIKKQITPEAELTARSITINPTVVEQLSELITKMKEVEPVFKNLNDGINLIIKTIIAQEGFDLSTLKELSLDDKAWVLNFKN